MKEKPIIFSTPMVRAVLDGRKTMTRRVINQDKEGIYDHYGNWVDPIEAYEYAHTNKKPRWFKGDILWVRETWAKSDGRELPAGYYYRADNDSAIKISRWNPSIHMPREAARIFLEVTDVRVERLQDITEEDAKAEGVEPVLRKTDGTVFLYAREGFRQLWDSLNAKRGYGWDANPWVYAISFRRIER